MCHFYIRDGIKLKAKVPIIIDTYKFFSIKINNYNFQVYFSSLIFNIYRVVSIININIYQL